MTTASVTALRSRARPRSVRVRNASEAAVMACLVACGLFTLVTTSLIIAILAKETWTFFHLDGVDLWSFLTGLQWSPLLGSEPHFGIWPLIVGTLMISAVAMAVALPLGLITAIWLSEYAPATLRSVLKPILEVLAGVPTVVFGFFALTVLTPALKWLYDGFSVYNATSAGIAVGILSLPIVTSLTEDALRAVPRSLRDGAYGLGATRFETSIKVVVPAALSGIISAFLLAVARAVGETMVVALAAGSTPPALHRSLGNAFDITTDTQPMTGYMVQIFLGDVSNFGPEYYSAYAVAAVLFIMTLMLTAIGHVIRIRFQQVYE